MRTSLRTWSVLLLIAVAGAAYVLVATSRYGIGYSSDSGGYVEPARAILSGQPFLASERSVLWPPLYACLLAFSAWVLRTDSLGAARYVNAGLFFAILLATGGWVLRRGKSRRTAWVAASALAVSYPLLVIARLALSDLLFVLLVLLFLFALERHLAVRSLRSLILPSFLAGAAILTRYAGMVLIPAGALFLVLDRGPSRARIRAAALFVLLSSVLPGLWVLRNLAVSGTCFGARAASSDSFFHTAVRTAGVVTHWLIPYDFPQVPRAVAGVLLLGVVLFATFLRALRARRDPASGWMLRFLLFAGLYLAYLVVSTARVAVEQISLRYVLPAYPPVVLCVLAWSSGVWADGRGRRWTRLLLVGMAAAWFLMSGLSGAALLRISLGKGTAEFSARRWSESALLHYLQTCPPPGPLLSNRPEPIYVYAKIDAGRAPRSHVLYRPDLPVQDLEAIRRRLESEGELYLVWFEDEENRALVPLADLEKALDLEVVAEFEDGGLFRIAARRESPIDSSAVTRK